MVPTVRGSTRKYLYGARAIGIAVTLTADVRQFDWNGGRSGRPGPLTGPLGRNVQGTSRQVLNLAFIRDPFGELVLPRAFR